MPGKPPVCKHPGTAIEREMLVRIKVLDYREDPKVLTFDNGYEPICMTEIHLAGLINEIMSVISKTTGCGTSTYWNKKQGVLNINKSDADVDDETKAAIASTFS